MGISTLIRQLFAAQRYSGGTAPWTENEVTLHLNILLDDLRCWSQEDGILADQRNGFLLNFISANCHSSCQRKCGSPHPEDSGLTKQCKHVNVILSLKLFWENAATLFTWSFRSVLPTKKLSISMKVESIMKEFCIFSTISLRVCFAQCDFETVHARLTQTVK